MTKDERRIIAENHFKKMEEQYKDYTESSIKYSKVIKDNKALTEEGLTEAHIHVEDMSAEEAIKTLGDGCCVLNFASFTRPGGGFIKGSIAQEEALCHVSNLYNVLKHFQEEFYDDNYKNHMNEGLYKDYAIYSPKIKFFIDDEIIDANVITCAAPNLSAYGNINTNCVKIFNYFFNLYNRIKFILDTADNHGCTKLVLGAFGCGVFGNDPNIVAAAFKNILKSYKYNFTEILFAIPKAKNNNYEAFCNTFNK